jgi:hypothetical protein
MRVAVGIALLHRQDGDVGASASTATSFCPVKRQEVSFKCGLPARRSVPRVDRVGRYASGLEEAHHVIVESRCEPGLPERRRNQAGGIELVHDRADWNCGLEAMTSGWSRSRVVSSFWSARKRD